MSSCKSSTSPRPSHRLRPRRRDREEGPRGRVLAPRRGAGLGVRDRRAVRPLGAAGGHGSPGLGVTAACHRRKRRCPARFNVGRACSKTRSGVAQRTRRGTSGSWRIRRRISRRAFDAILQSRVLRWVRLSGRKRRILVTAGTKISGPLKATTALRTQSFLCCVLGESPSPSEGVDIENGGRQR
jgi:hypothetical protein